MLTLQIPRLRRTRPPRIRAPLSSLLLKTTAPLTQTAVVLGQSHLKTPHRPLQMRIPQRKVQIPHLAIPHLAMPPLALPLRQLVTTLNPLAMPPCQIPPPLHQQATFPPLIRRHPLLVTLLITAPRLLLLQIKAHLIVLPKMRVPLRCLKALIILRARATQLRRR